jgi:hypothetical protein
MSSASMPTYLPAGDSHDYLIALTFLLITARHGPRRKRRSSFLYRIITVDTLVCEAVT